MWAEGPRRLTPVPPSSSRPRSLPAGFAEPSGCRLPRIRDHKIGWASDQEWHLNPVKATSTGTLVCRRQRLTDGLIGGGELDDPPLPRPPLPHPTPLPPPHLHPPPS